MLKKLIWMAIIVISIPLMSSAQIYKFRDTNGVLRFTDNLAEVPEAQRQNVQQYQEIKRAPLDGVEANAQRTKAEGEDNAASDEQNLNRAEQLKALKTELASEYQYLTQEKQRLDQMRASRLTPTEKKVMDQAAKDLNERIRIYDSKRRQFEQDLNNYNSLNQ